jgi:hypothetical protein
MMETTIIIQNDDCKRGKKNADDPLHKSEKQIMEV